MTNASRNLGISFLLSKKHVHHDDEHGVSVRKTIIASMVLSATLLALPSAFAAPAANALPTNGQVVAGQASINQAGNVMNINQSTQRAVINWDSFNVGKNATVNFNQPNANSSTLNRVNSASKSMIDGAVRSNGQVIFVNPNGVVFGKGAEVNTGGLVATTMDIKDSDYMSGKMHFSGGESGKVINKGTITANGVNGYIALMAPEVKNQGVLIANISNSNTIALVSGTKVTLSFNGSQLTDISVDASAINSLISNKHAIIANGGQIIIAANAASNLKASVINNTGTINSDSITTSGGKVFLTAGTVNQNGTVSANSETQNAGQVVISGNQIKLNESSKTTATGATSGGQILIGKTSANTAQSQVNADVVTVAKGAIVDASATQNGNGGSISIWSQVQTTVAGTLKAMGGAISGNGGNIDTSSAKTVTYGSSLVVDTTAPHGKTGNWTTDPLTIIIDGNAATVLSNALSTTNVTLDATAATCGLGACTQTGTPVITFLADVYSANPLTSLYLNAQGGSINVNSNVTAGSVYAVAQTIDINGSLNTNGGSSSSIYLAGVIINILGNINSNGNSNNNTNSGNLNSANTATANNRRNSMNGQNGQNGLTSDSTIYASNGGSINIIASGDINIGSNTNSTSYISANGQNGGSINIISVNGNINNYGIVDAVGKNNLGGAITLAAQNANTFNGALIAADGYTQGGIIQIGVANSIGSGSTLAPPSINSQVATLLAAVNFTPSSNILSNNTSLNNATVITANAVSSNSSSTPQVVLNSQAGQIYIAGNNSLNTAATIQSNADNGGLIILSSPAGTYQNSGYIQTNGGAGLGGTIAQSGLISTSLIGATLESNGQQGGGNIVTGRDFQASPLPGSAAQDALLPSLSSVITVPTSQLTTVDANSILSANGITSGNGGNVLVWGNTNNVAGTLSAQALGKNSNGGFIETSGHTLNVVNSASISTASNNGTTGTWLLDPYDFYIASSGGNITGANLTTALSNNSVTITAANTCSGIACTATSNGTLGNIYVNDNVSWSANTLTLNSGYNIYVGTPSSMGSLTVTGSGSLTLAPSNSGVSGYTSGGQVLMGMASSSTSGLTSGYLSGSSFTTGAATGFNGQINVSTSGTIKFGSNTYTALNSESDFVGINLSSNYVIGSNLSFSTAYSAAVVSGFSGILNGFGHLISGLSINSTSSSGTNIGLFGNTSGTFSNMGLAGSVLASYDNNGVGAFAGHTSGATITNSYSTASVTGVNYVGGLVGLGQSANIYSSYSTGSILTTGSNAGGLVGYLYGGTIQSSYSTSNVSGPDTVGGLTGSVQNNSSVSNSYSIGTITGNTAGNNHQNFGGLFAYLPCGNVCTFTNNYFGGAIVTATGNSSIGGIAGGASGTNSFSGNYWNSTTNPGLNASTGGFPSSVVVSGVSSITTAQLKNASNFSSGFGNTSGSFTIASGWGYQPGVNSGFPILCAINNCTSYSSSLVSLTYAGTSGGLWETASNWDVTGSSTPSSIAPISTNASSISSLIIPSTYTVNYNTASVGPLGLSITNNGTISFSGNSNVTLSGVISGSGAIIKNGAGTVSLTAANTYGGATTINAGTLVLSGSGTLGNSSSLLTISSGTLDIQNGAVTVGSLSMSGTNPSITNSTGTSSLTISGTSTLAGSITTSGAQTYSGAVTLGANAALTATNSNITFTSAVDSTAGGYYGLSVSNGAGTTAFGGVVGGNSANSALGYLCINSSGCNASAVGTTANTGTTTLAGNVTTSGNQNYGGNLVLAGNVNLSSTSNGGNGAVTIAGSVNTSSSSGYLYLEGIGYTNGTLTATSNSGVYIYGGNAYTLALGTSVTLAIGTLTYSSYSSVNYQSSYSFTPSSSFSTNYLIVAGGGSADTNGHGGAGGGGVVTNAYNGGHALLSSASLTASTAYSIVIGNGGSGGNNGYNSLAFGYTAIGGGGSDNSDTGAKSGGSAGGSRDQYNGVSTQYSVYGYGFGSGTATSNTCSCSWGIGGGGAGGPSSSTTASGGAAYLWIDGNYYAGGGGAGSNGSTTTTGGITTNLGGGTAILAQQGGGGNGGVNNSTVGSKGVNGTGGGAGGSAANLNANTPPTGGSGLVAFTYNINSSYALTINSGTGAATIGGGVSNITTLAINSKSASSSIAGAIGGSTAVTYNSSSGYTAAGGNTAGVLSLSGNNTYSGGTTVSGGTLQAGSATAFGSSAGAITISSGAALDLNGQTLTNTNALTLIGTGISNGGALSNSSTNPGTYAGAVTLGSNTTVGGTGAITFGSTVDSSSSSAYSLASATGANNALTFSGAVGGNYALSSLTTGTGTTTLAGNVTTSGNQNYGGNLVLAGNVNLSSTSNGGNGAVTVSGSVNSSSVVGSGIIEFLGSGYWGVSTSSGSTWAYYLANSGTNTYQSSFLISGTTYTSSLSALSSPPTISYSGGNYSFSPVTSSAISYLAVGGGGAGGQNGGGGGGAGGVLTNVGSSLVTFAANTSYSIVVGAGGSSGGNGFASSISGAGITTVTALGGGYGGVGGNNGNSGGSGGGGGQCGCQLGLGGAGVSGQGYAGGNAETSSPYYSGGGGGAGAQGASATSIAAGAGGSGILNPITGSNIGQSSGGNYYIAGGGGGGSWSGVGASGGLGGGGSAPSSSGVGTSGLVNTGSGGGGSENGNNGGNGGSGVVILSSTTLIGVQNTYALTINSGTGAATIGGSVSNITTLAINSKSASSSIAGAIGGSTALKLNTGTVATVGADYTGANSSSAVLNLAGNNTYSGGTTISGGTLQAGSATAFGASAGAITVNNGAALDLNGQTLTNTNTLTLNGTGINSGGALTNSSINPGTYVGGMTLASASLIGSTTGAITMSGAIASSANAYNLALVGNQAITLSSATNTLSTIASGSSLGALSISNNQTMTIGSMTIGGTNYSGLSSTGIILIKTLSGNLNINNSVSTTSTSSNTLAPAILLSAGYNDATTNTSDNIVLGSSSSSLITAGNGAIIALYSGAPSASTNLTAFTSAQSVNYFNYGTTTSSLPSSGLGYYAIYRGTQPTLYVIFGASNTPTYGSAPTITYTFNTLANGTGTSYLSTDTATVNATGTALFKGTNTTTSASNVSLNSSANAGSYSNVTYLSGLSSPIYALSAGSTVGTLTINKANAYIGLSNNIQSSTYGTNPSFGYTVYSNQAGTTTLTTTNPTGSVTFKDTTLGVATTINSSANAGTYNNVSYTGGLTSTNYNFAAINSVATYTVNQAQAYVIITPSQSSIYGATPTINYTFNTNSAGTGSIISAAPAGLSGTATITNAPTSSSNAGTYNLTYASGLSSTNYAFNPAASAVPYTVNQAPLSITISKAYNGSAGFTSANTYSLSGTTYNGDSLPTIASGAASVSSPNATTYTGFASNGLTLSNANYTLTGGTVSATISPKTITYTTSDATSVYGTLATLSTPVFVGLVGSDNPGASVSLYSGTTPVSLSTTTNAGTYAQQVAITNGNYQIASTGNGIGNLVISPATLAITGANNTPTYNGSTQTNTGVTVSLNGGAASAISGTTVSTGIGAQTFTLSGLASGLNASTTAIADNLSITPNAASGAISSNYSISYTNGSLTIGKANLSVTGTQVYNGTATIAGSSLTISGVAGQTFTGSGTADLTTKNVQSNQQLASVNGLVLTPNGSFLVSNYNTINVANTSVSITPLAITLSAPSITKVYDGGYTYNMTAANLATMSSQLAGGDTVSAASVVFTGNNPNVGTNKSVSLNSATISDGNGGSNYAVTLANSSTSQVTPAALTITANNASKFVTQSDTVGFNGVAYSGFVNGETASSALSGTLTVTRSNASTNGAGSYTGVLTPGGVAANNGNYTITPVAGNFTIVAANQLLVQVTPVTTTYGTAPTYTATAQYLSCSVSGCPSSGSVNTIHTLSPVIIGNAFSVNDGAGGTAGFTISPTGATSSGSGNTNVGSYQLSNGAMTGSSTNFSNTLVLTGALTVTPLTLAANQLGVSGISKVYNGSTAISGLSLNTTAASSSIKTGDAVVIAGTGTYADANVGTSKSVTVSVGLTGNDAGNYVLSSNQITANIGTITQLASVTYTGTSGGNWSNASNWAGGAIPTLGNVATVVIPTATTVVYDAANLSALTPTSAITDNGTLSFTSGLPTTFANNVSGTGSIAQSGAGALTLTGGNSYSGGTTLASGSSLIAGSSSALGTGALNSSGGTFSTSGVTLPNLTVNGAVVLASNITSSGNQAYNGAVTINNSANSTTLSSSAGNITFGSTLNAGASNQSLVLRADAGQVTFNGQVGVTTQTYNTGTQSYSPTTYSGYQSQSSNNLANLTVSANTINLSADITTRLTQIYNGSLLVGDNGSNGPTRVLLSEDPAIIFNGTINDTVAGTPNVFVKAVTIANEAPSIVFNDVVGGVAALKSLTASTGAQDAATGALYSAIDTTPANLVGIVTIKENVSTTGDQTYTAKGFTLGNGTVNQTLSLTTQTGNIAFNAGSSSGSGFTPAGSGLIVSIFNGGGTVSGLSGSGLNYSVTDTTASASSSSTTSTSNSTSAPYSDGGALQNSFNNEFMQLASEIMYDQSGGSVTVGFPSEACVLRYEASYLSCVQ